MKKLLLKVTLAVVLALGFNITANAFVMGQMNEGMEGMDQFNQVTQAVKAVQSVTKAVGELGHNGKEAFEQMKSSGPVSAVTDAESGLLTAEQIESKRAVDIGVRVKTLNDDVEGNAVVSGDVEEDAAVSPKNGVKASAEADKADLEEESNGLQSNGPSTFDKFLGYAGRITPIISMIAFVMLAIL